MGPYVSSLLDVGTRRSRRAASNTAGLRRIKAAAATGTSSRLFVGKRREGSGVSRPKCDLFLGRPPGWDWALEVKLAAFEGQCLMGLALRWNREHPEAVRAYSRRVKLKRRWKLYAEQHQDAEPYPDLRFRATRKQRPGPVGEPG